MSCFFDIRIMYYNANENVGKFCFEQRWLRSLQFWVSLDNNIGGYGQISLTKKGEAPFGQYFSWT